MGGPESGNVPWVDYSTGSLEGHDVKEIEESRGKPEIMRFFYF